MSAVVELAEHALGDPPSPLDLTVVQVTQAESSNDEQRHVGSAVLFRQGVAALDQRKPLGEALAAAAHDDEPVVRAKAGDGVDVAESLGEIAADLRHVFNVDGRRRRDVDHGHAAQVERRAQHQATEVVVHLGALGERRVAEIPGLPVEVRGCGYDGSRSASPGSVQQRLDRLARGCRCARSDARRAPTRSVRVARGPTSSRCPMRSCSCRRCFRSSPS